MCLPRLVERLDSAIRGKCKDDVGVCLLRFFENVHDRVCLRLQYLRQIKYCIFHACWRDLIALLFLVMLVVLGT